MVKPTASRFCGLPLLRQVRRPVGTLGAACALALAASSPASSHITFDRPSAVSRASFRGVLRVPHGCDGATTIAIQVTIPEGIIGAKPMPKPGWALEIKKAAYAKTYAFMHGTLASGATSFTWQGGGLPDDMYDEFVFQAYVSDALKPGTIVAFPVIQSCSGGRSLRWTEIEKPGGTATDLKLPAPSVHIVGASSASAPASGDPRTRNAERSAASAAIGGRGLLARHARRDFLIVVPAAVIRDGSATARSLFCWLRSPP